MLLQEELRNTQMSEHICRFFWSLETRKFYSISVNLSEFRIQVVGKVNTN